VKQVSPYSQSSLKTSPMLPLRVVVLLPVCDDWVAASELIRSLDRTVSLDDPTVCLEVLIVDDGSVESWTEAHFNSQFACVKAIRVLRLYRNLGHQRAIAVGLVYIEDKMHGDAVLVMDADGEDTPDGAVQLIREFSGPEERRRLVFAERARRFEPFTFRLFYRIYRMLHHALTGVAVRVGNFSIMPWNYLSSLSVLAELWNHYAATVFRSRLPFTMIPIARGRRIAGASRMNFVSLVTHGLSAVSVFADIVGVRLLMSSAVTSVLAALGIGAVVAIRLFTNAAIPGWATYSAGILTIITIQLVTVASCFTFLILSARSTPAFIPHRDALLFVKEVNTAYQYV
jgi:glycosyltransferase involved in cell wall biosynthesis